MRSPLLALAFTFVSLSAQAAPDASVEALRGCLLGLDDRAHVSRDLGIAVVGGTRAHKAGVYSLTPGGYLYFHDCPQSSGRLEYPRKSSPAQADYQLPAGQGLQVSNPAVTKVLPPESWSIDGATSPAATGACVGTRVKDAAATSHMMKRVRRLALESIFGKEQALVERLQRDAIEVLKRKSRNSGAARSGQVAVFRFTPEQLKAEALNLLRSKQQAVVSCRDALKASAPEEKAALAELNDRVAAAEWAASALSPPNTAPVSEASAGSAGAR